MPALQGTIYNSFENNELFYKLKEEQINNTTNLYTGQIGYKTENDIIQFKFGVENQTNIYNKTPYRYCMSTDDDATEYNTNVRTDTMTDEPDSDIFACFYFPKTKNIVPVSDVFGSIFPLTKTTIILDRDYSR